MPCSYLEQNAYYFTNEDFYYYYQSLAIKAQSVSFQFDFQIQQKTVKSSLSTVHV